MTTNWFSGFLRAYALMKKAIVGAGVSDIQAMDVYFGSNLCSRLHKGGTYTPEETEAFLQECKSVRKDDFHFMNGSFCYLLTKVLARASCMTSIGPGALYSAIRRTSYYVELGHYARLFSRRCRPDTLDLIESRIIAVYRGADPGGFYDGIDCDRGWEAVLLRAAKRDGATDAQILHAFFGSSLCEKLETGQGFSDEDLTVFERLWRGSDRGTEFTSLGIPAYYVTSLIAGASEKSGIHPSELYRMLRGTELLDSILSVSIACAHDDRPEVQKRFESEILALFVERRLEDRFNQK